MVHNFVFCALFTVQRYNKYLEYARIFQRKLNLFRFLAGKTCYSHDCATVTSEDSLFRMNKGVPKVQQIFDICKDLHKKTHPKMRFLLLYPINS